MVTFCLTINRETKPGPEQIHIKYTSAVALRHCLQAILDDGELVSVSSRDVAVLRMVSNEPDAR
jgi:hypothetical protein